MAVSGGTVCVCVSAGCVAVSVVVVAVVRLALVALADRGPAQRVARVAQALAQALVDGRGQVVDAVVDLAQLAADVLAAAVLDGLADVLDLALEVARARGRDAALRGAAAGDEQRGAHAEQEREEVGDGARHAH